MSKTKQTYKPVAHDPFLIRKGIVIFGVACGIFSGFWHKDLVLSFCVYFLSVTLVDLAIHFLWGKKSSDFVHQKLLAKNEGISMVDLDRFHDSRRNIRLISLIFACLFLTVWFSCELFCWAYIAATCLSSLYARYVLKIVGPRLQIRPLSLQERNLAMADEIFFGVATGFGKYGILRKDN